MAFLTTGLVAEVIIACWHPGRNQDGLNIVHFNCSSNAGFGATDQQIADLVSATMAPNYTNIIGTDATYWGAACRILTTPLPIMATSRVGTGPGVVGAKSLPNQVCGLVKLGTPLAGRANRGRMFIPFIDRGYQDPAAETPTAGLVTALGILGANLLSITTAGTFPNTSTFRLSIVHRQPVIFRAGVSFVTARTLWATQRRRGDEGRPNYPPW